MTDKDLVTMSQLRNTSERVVSSMNDMVDDNEFAAEMTQLHSEHQSILAKLDELCGATILPSAEEVSF